MPIERKLAAIMFTDIAGYTALSAKDETKALELLDTQEEILTPIIEEFNGTLHNRIGDGLLFTFPTVTDAIKCGIKIQKETKEVEDLNLRIGIHEGEITLKNGDALGDDVNVASRIDPFAAEGGIVISGKVQQNISSLPEFKTKFISEPLLKGVRQEVKVFCIISHGLPETDITKVTAKLEKDVQKLWFNQKSIIAAIAVLSILIIGSLLWISKNNWWIDDISDNSLDSHLVYIGSPENWIGSFKEDITLANYLETNIGFEVYELESEQLDIIRMEVESHLLNEFYKQNIEVKMLASNDEIEFMKNAFESNEFENDHEIAIATSEHFEKSTSIIFLKIYAIKDINNTIVQYFLDITLRRLPGWDTMRASNLLDTKKINDEIYDGIVFFIKSISKNKLSGYVTKVDGNIIYINPGGLDLRKNMNLYGHNLYNLHDKDSDGLTDKDSDWKEQVDDWQRAIGIINESNDYSKTEIERINQIYSTLTQDSLSKVYRGQYYGENSYSLKVSEVIDTTVIAKLVSLDNPWVKIRAGDLIRLK